MKYKLSKNVPDRVYKCKYCGAKFTAEYNDQQVCSYECAFGFYQNIENKGRASARSIAYMVGRKSIAEVEFEVSHCGLGHEYEPETWDYMPTVKLSKYTPDFVFDKKKGGKMYIEFKGKLDLDTRKKLLDIKKQHPKKDLRLIFKRPKNKISKRSKTTYYQWATKAGFKVSHHDGMPTDWMKEIKT